MLRMRSATPHAGKRERVASGTAGGRARVEVVAEALGARLVDDANRALQQRPRQRAREFAGRAAEVEREAAAAAGARRVQQALVRACTRALRTCTRPSAAVQLAGGRTDVLTPNSLCRSRGQG